MVVVLQENEKTLSPKLIEIKGVRALFYMISLSKSRYKCSVFVCTCLLQRDCKVFMYNMNNL